MGSKRKIQINNKRNKKNKKTRKQKGGFNPLSMIPGANLAILQLKLMKAQMKLQIAFFKTDPTKPDQICKLGKEAMTEINSILKEPDLSFVKELIGGPLDEITAVLSASNCADEVKDKIKKIVEPMFDKLAYAIRDKLPNMLKEALKGGKDQLKPTLEKLKSAGAQIPIEGDELDEFFENPFVQKVLSDTPAPEASEDSGDSGDSGAASTGDSGAASTGSSSAPGSQFKDDPETGVELAKKKIAIHKEAKDEAKVAKYKKSLEKYEAMVSGGGGTKRNKKNKKRKTIKIKCL